MEYYFENQRMICDLQEDLISIYIKELVDKVKSLILNNLDSFETLIINLDVVENMDSIGVTFLIGVFKTLEQYGKT
ncbi:MAG: STAS domain-containing protein [Clostridia bacterium]|nr:STAS domain-containing protein [Clostridia bacterium]